MDNGNRIPALWRLLATALCAVGLAVANLRGAAPTLDQLFPVVVPIGSTQSVALVGKFDPWPPRLWSDSPAIRFEVPTNQGPCRVIVGADAKPGPHLVRASNDDGASAPRFLVVEQERAVDEIEPNDEFRKPQVLTNLPVSLNGRLEKSGDVDSYSVAVEAGQTLVASLQGYVFQSPFDGVLRILDERGVQQAWNHDDGRTLDPLVWFTAREAGRHVIQVFGFEHPANSDVRFVGNAKCAYRLRISAGPVVRYALPLGVQRGATTRLRLFGYARLAPALREVDYDRTAVGTNAPAAEGAWSGIEGSLSLPVGDGPELVAAELGGSFVTNGLLPLPGAVSAVLSMAGEEDRFRVAARKDERWLIEVHSARLGFPLDAWLRVDDAAGKELTRNDDSETADPRLEWSAPADGEYVFVLGSLVRRGGPDFLYRISAMKLQPELKATLASDTSTVEPGKTNEFKLTVGRKNGFTAKLVTVVEGLPPGVSAETVDVPDKDGEVVIKMVAAADAKPAGGPIRVLLREKETGRVYPARFELAGTGENNGVPQGFKQLVISTHEQPWFTVVPAAKKEPEKAEKK